MQKSLLAGRGLEGVDLPEINPRTPNPPRPPEPMWQPQPAQPEVVRPVQSEPIQQPEPPRPPEPVRPERGYPVTRPDTASHVVQPVTNPPAPKRQAGRPRLYADHVLTPTEKARRYRQKRKAVTADALDGSLLPVEVALLGNRDLCLTVARILNRQGDLELRQTGSPLVKELQRRLKSL